MVCLTQDWDASWQFRLYMFRVRFHYFSLFQYSHHLSQPVFDYLIYNYQTMSSLFCLNWMITDQTSIFSSSSQMWSNSGSDANPLQNKNTCVICKINTNFNNIDLLSQFKRTPCYTILMSGSFMNNLPNRKYWVRIIFAKITIFIFRCHRIWDFSCQFSCNTWEVII